MEDRAVRLSKVAVAPEAVQLPPGTATGMAIGPQVVQPQPTAIAQFISICRWLKLIRKERLAPHENTPFFTP
jgi:hypothetical protein